MLATAQPNSITPKRHKYKVAAGHCCLLDEAAYPFVLQHFLAFSEDDRSWRFSSALSNGAIETYCESIHFEQDIVVGYIDDGVVHGVVHLACFTEGASKVPVGEVGISVDEEMRNLGIGRRMLALSLALATKRGLKKVYINFRYNNHPMRALATKFGATITSDSGESVGTVSLPMASDIADACASHVHVPCA